MLFSRKNHFDTLSNIRCILECRLCGDQARLLSCRKAVPSGSVSRPPGEGGGVPAAGQGVRWVPGAPLLDSEADDILEELIVGNHVPPETSLATLLADLQKTEIFLRFREGRDHFLHKRYHAAELCFADVLGRAPTNILYHLFYARTLAVRGAYHRAVHHYRCALKIGRSRVPVQPLIRVEAELNALRRKCHPLLSRIFGLVPPPTPVFIPDPADEMVAQLSRSLTAAARKALPHDGKCR